MLQSLDVDLIMVWWRFECCW